MSEVLLKIRNIQFSPYKLNLLLKSIRNLNVHNAKHTMTFSKSRASGVVIHTINQAVSVMQDKFGVSDVSKCYIGEAYVGKGMRLKRVMPRAKGRMYRILKTRSHMYIKLVYKSGVDFIDNADKKEGNK